MPIAGSSDQSWSSNELADSDKTKKKKKTTTTKKAVSRMKELLKRAVNWKKGGSKQVDYDVDSPKMRFGDDEIEKWINTIEKWITTDSECMYISFLHLLSKIHSLYTIPYIFVFISCLLDLICLVVVLELSPTTSSCGWLTSYRIMRSWACPRNSWGRT